MTRSEMVTRSHPTHAAPGGGCLLLGNHRGSASSFSGGNIPGIKWVFLQNCRNLVGVPEEGGLGPRG